MVKVGDVCPLFFSPIKYEFGLDMDYIQKFHSSDKIHIQVFTNASEEVSVILNNNIMIIMECIMPFSKIWKMVNIQLQLMRIHRNLLW